MFEAIKRRRVQARRQKALSEIRQERLEFETMVKRAELSGRVPGEFVKDIQTRLETIESKAGEASVEELDDLVDQAEWLARLRAYLCPHAEIPTDGRLLFDVMEEWGVPSAVIAKLRDSLGPKLDDRDATVARGSLRAILEEYDSWSSYVDDYENTMDRSTLVLLGGIVGLSLLAIILLHFPRTVVYGLFAAGVAGACVSVIARLPALSLSGEFTAYQRRIRSRIGTGVVASLIGCALLGWGLIPIAIQNQTFADLLNGCSSSISTSCTEGKILILWGVPTLFGFSERALMSLEERMFGSPKE